MCNSGFFGGCGNSCSWIIILLIIWAACSGNNGCGCGCGCDNNCNNNCGC